MVTLEQVVILLAAAVIAVPLFKRLNLGSVLGYLAAGIVIGPAALGFIRHVESVLSFSEFGVVLLLFIIGLELKPSRLWVMRRSVFGMGGAQVVLTGLVLGGAGYLVGLPFPAAVVAGFGLALSSTAFVLPILGERNDLMSAHGRASFAVLLFQDLAIIPLLALMPLLSAAPAAPEAGHPLINALEILGVFAAVFAGGRFLVRPLFRAVASAGNHEVFTATALLIVVGTATLMHHVGLSMSLGAFLAGVLLAESEYRHELQADIEPFKGLLLGLFFMAVGMSTNVGLVLEMPLVVIGSVLGFVALKGAVIYGIGRLAGYSSDDARHIAFILPQGGEFAFVLFSVAVSQQILDRQQADLLVLAVTVSMILTPFLVRLDDRITRQRASSEARAFDTIDGGDNPVIIAGFGRFGQIVARVLRMRNIGFTALEASPSQVDFVRRFGNKVYYGDASRLDLLRAASADRAKVFVLAIDDVEASVRTAEMVRRHFPELRILARARNRNHAHQLMSMGVEVLIRETFLSSLWLTVEVLKTLGFAESEAEDTVAKFRENDERNLVKQLAFRHDEAQLIQSAQQVSRELQGLFEEDSAAPVQPVEASR